VVARLGAALSRESDPAPLKYALSQMKLVSPRVRLPLVELKSESRAEIERVLAQISAKYSGYLMDEVARERGNGIPPVDPAPAKPKFVLVS
jgi:hypothetical protein